MAPPPKNKPSADTSKDTIDVRLEGLTRELDRLKSLYEQHFAGVIKLEPLKENDHFKNLLRSVLPSDLKTTVAKFKHQAIQARYSQLSVQWQKIQKKIEEGTYRPDILMAEKRAKERDSIVQEKPSATPTTPQPPKASPLEKVYEQMKKIAGTSQKLPSKEAFIAQLEKQVQIQKEKNPGKKVEIKLQKGDSGKIGIKISMK